MKTLYITIFLLAGVVSLHAQENKTAEKQDDIKAIKESKAFEAKMMKQQADKKDEAKTSKLASEQGIEQKKQSSEQPKSSGNSRKLLANTASFEEVLTSIPNRKVVRNAGPKATNSVKGLPNTATLEEIKKTIPKN
ncbi:hypothetical protein LUD75_03375 [Epilithonimonas sp. JDS]|uniref:hypothetical protein n=1 Tax=Epilithonimonas sp. JDS TaxID=2902797 RepID=UPI001E441D63|nr:hypothetical protein [Epilithonimonas sp. JDS]MCD9853727.1 hypothetical protein [Epilithonimonas sp. JDS]